MDLEPMSIVAGLAVSTVGFVLFRYGKKQERMPQLGVGLLMMAGPMFTPGALSCFAMGTALALGLWLMVRIGW